MKLNPDIIVIGGGPAGGTAALFGARVGRQVLLLGESLAGSSIAGTQAIDNYPGMPFVPGVRFLENLCQQCTESGVEMINGSVTDLRLENRRKMVTLSSGPEYSAPALILASGTDPVHPVFPGIDRLWGRGISHCAWCDGAFFRGKRVAVLGSGNAAFAQAEILVRLASEVHLLLSKRSGTAFASLREKIAGAKNLRVHREVVVKEVHGPGSLEKIELTEEGQPGTLEVECLFIAVGQKPRTEFAKEIVPLSRSGHIIADSMGRTNVPGIFAAGDVIDGVFRQLVTACGSGATAALAAEQYLTAQWETSGSSAEIGPRSFLKNQS